MIAPLPDNEAARLEALRRYDILDTPPEAAFDDFVRLAAHICGVPTAMVSLVEEDRQWFKARVGMAACQTGRDVSFCAHALLQPDVFLVPDAAADPRFADNPLVTGELRIRFYAGAPLISPEGHALGALCVTDRTPRTLTAEQQDALQSLARQVVAQMELRRSLAERAEAEAALRRANSLLLAQQEAAADGVLVVDEQQRVVSCNRRFREMWRIPDVSADDTDTYSDHAIAQMQDLCEFLRQMESLYAHPQEHGHGELHLKDGRVLDRYSAPVTGEDGSHYGRVWYFRDVTERKAAEAARLRAHSVLRSQQEAAIDGILVVDEENRVVSHNQRFRELWHIPDALAGEGKEDPFLAYALAQLRDPHEFLEKVTHLYAHPQEHSRDELHLKDGRVFDRYSGPATSPDGQHYGRVWYFRDVTERKRTEEALRQAHDELEMHVHERTMQLERAEEDYRSLFENAVDGIFQTRPDGSYLRANPALAALYGYASPEELMAELRATSLYVVPGRRAEFARRMREHDAVSEFESAVWRKDGTTIWISESSRAIRDEQGEIVRYEGMVVDVTERRRAQEALRESEARFQSIVANMPGMVYRFVLRPDGTTAFPYVSDGCREVYGLEPDDVRRDAGLILGTVPPEDQAEFAHSIAESARTLQPWLWQRGVVRPDGAERYIQAAARPRFQDNGDIVWDGVVMDVTERRQAEEALRASEADLRRSNSVLQAQQEAAIDGILIVDEDRRIVSFNRRFCELWDIPVAVASRSDDTPVLARVVEQVQGTDEFLRRVEYLYAHPRESGRDEVRLTDGRVFDRYSGPVSSEEGQDYGRIWYFRDITERKRAEEALRASHEMLQSIMDSIPQRIFWKDFHSVYQGGNRNFACAAGLCRPEDIVGKTDYDFSWEKETADQFRAVDRRVMDSNTAELSLVESARQVGGEQSWSETNKIPLHDADGRVVGILGTYEDITERRQAEEALRDRTQILGNILSTIPHLVFWKDTDLVYQGGNVNIARAAGLSSPEEIVGKTDYDLPWAAEETAAFRELDRQVMTSGEPMLNVEQTLLRADGVSVTGLTSKIPLRDEAGRIFGVLGIYHDITERRQAEEALRASEERLRTVVGGLPLILFALDEDGVITLSDGRGLNALGLKPGEDVGKSMPALYEACPDVQDAIRRALAGETVSIFQEFASVVFETQFIPQYDDSGRTSGLIGVSLDVTERQWAEREILNLNAQLEQRLDRITMLNFDLAQAYDATIEGWSRALDLRDKETEGHSRRVTDLTLRLADAFGLGPEEMIHIRRGALLHDIGKMGIPDAILLKPGPLSADERALMQRHPDYARAMLSPIEFLRPALDIPYGHHEKWDGTGYPAGLAGPAIPLAARLFAVVDVWDALRSDRPYRSAWSWQRTRDHIASLSGTHFDPQVVHIFLEIAAAEAQPEERPLLAA